MLERRAAVAGSFYPEQPDRLRGEVEALLDDAGVPDLGGAEPVGLLVPHAGYVFSGPVAARGYATVRGRSYSSVLLAGPAHREPVTGAVLPGDGYYSTPLGEVAIDEERVQRLIGRGGGMLSEGSAGHGDRGSVVEHSLEVQLPFLQVALEGDFKLAPLAMGSGGRELAQAAADALAGVASDGDTLLVASSDLSHFHRDGQARELDSLVREAVAEMDEARLWEVLTRQGAEACGATAIAAVMGACKALGATRAVELAYGTSGDAPGAPRDRVVGYLATVFVR